MPGELIGSTLGQYEIIRELGHGAMGAVYQAHELTLGRMVALKILMEHLARDQTYLQRFYREARAAAQLNHPNIVTIYNVGAAEGRHFIAMEFVKGRELTTVLETQNLIRYADALEIVRQTASALALAHGLGIVHRDIKPGNIMIDLQGRVKVMDFGIAKFGEESSRKLTLDGALLGTPSYMSPEQCSGFDVDVRTDVYSLGVVFYEMLAGRLPFPDQNPLALINKITNEPIPPITDFNPDVPPDVVRILNHALAKNPANRYASCSELEVDINHVLTTRRTDHVIQFLNPKERTEKPPSDNWMSGPATLFLSSQTDKPGVMKVDEVPTASISRKEILLDVLRQSMDFKHVTGQMVQEIVDALDRIDTARLEPLLEQLVQLEMHGKSYLESFARWWNVEGRRRLYGLDEDKGSALQQAISFFTGAGGRVDERRARELFEEAAATNDVNARLWIVRCQRESLCGFPADLRSARNTAAALADEIQQRAEHGDPESAYLWGTMLESGFCAKRDLRLAIQNYTRATEGGHTQAMIQLGRIYQSDALGRQDLPAAAEWFRKASDAGDVYGIVALAEMAANGDGIPADDRQAFQLYFKAAQLGATASMIRLGALYEQGCGVVADLRQAEAWYQKAADLGDVEGFYCMGRMFEESKDQEDLNFKRALEWYQKGVAMGHAGCMFRVGHMYELGRGVGADLHAAIDWYLKAAHKLQPDACHRLGTLHEEGRGLPRNDSHAFDWHRKAAEHGCVPAMHRLAQIYRSTYLPVKSIHDAVIWFRRAAEAGNTAAMLELGGLYEGGREVSPDPEQALYWFRLAAEAGDRNAMVHLGEIHESGISGLSRNMPEAIAWYERAARAGHAAVMHHLGGIYEKGDGVTADMAVALSWYQKAGSVGHGPSLNRLGDYHRDPMSPEHDLARAITWYEDAAEAGDTDAMMTLGFMHESGEGVRRSYPTARQWYQRAFDAKAPDAGERLKKIQYRL